jgi:hypothetical protein
MFMKGLHVSSVHFCHQFMAHDKCHLLKESKHAAGVSPNRGGTHGLLRALCVFEECTHWRRKEVPR